MPQRDFTKVARLRPTISNDDAPAARPGCPPETLTPGHRLGLVSERALRLHMKYLSSVGIPRRP